MLSKSERRRSEDESKHPEDVLATKPHQGILLMMLVLPSCVMREGRFYKFWVYITGAVPERSKRWEDLAEHWGQEVLSRGQSLKRTP